MHLQLLYYVQQTVLFLLVILFVIGYTSNNCLGDLNIAKKKVIKAQNTDDLSSHTEILTKKVNKLHKRRQGTNKHNDYSDTDESYESNCGMSDKDSNTYPSFPLSGNRHVEHGKMITFLVRILFIFKK